MLIKFLKDDEYVVGQANKLTEYCNNVSQTEGNISSESKSLIITRDELYFPKMNASEVEFQTKMVSFKRESQSCRGHESKSPFVT